MKGNSASLAHDLCVLSSQTCAAHASKCRDELASCLYRYLRQFIKSFYFRNGSSPDHQVAHLASRLSEVKPTTLVR